MISALSSNAMKLSLKFCTLHKSYARIWSHNRISYSIYNNLEGTWGPLALCHPDHGLQGDGMVVRLLAISRVLQITIMSRSYHWDPVCFCLLERYQNPVFVHFLDEREVDLCGEFRCWENRPLGRSWMKAEAQKTLQVKFSWFYFG